VRIGEEKKKKEKETTAAKYMTPRCLKETIQSVCGVSREAGRVYDGNNL